MGCIWAMQAALRTRKYSTAKRSSPAQHPPATISRSAASMRPASSRGRSSANAVSERQGRVNTARPAFGSRAVPTPRQPALAHSRRTCGVSEHRALLPLHMGPHVPPHTVVLQRDRLSRQVGWAMSVQVGHNRRSTRQEMQAGGTGKTGRMRCRLPLARHAGKADPRRVGSGGAPGRGPPPPRTAGTPRSCDSSPASLKAEKAGGQRDRAVDQASCIVGLENAAWSRPTAQPQRPRIVC